MRFIDASAPMISGNAAGACRVNHRPPLIQLLSPQMLVRTIGLSNKNKVPPMGSMKRVQLCIVHCIFFSLFLVRLPLMEPQVHADSLEDGSKVLPFLGHKSRISSHPVGHQCTIECSAHKYTKWLCIIFRHISRFIVGGYPNWRRHQEYLYAVYVEGRGILSILNKARIQATVFHLKAMSYVNRPCVTVS